MPAGDEAEDAVSVPLYQFCGWIRESISAASVADITKATTPLILKGS